VATCHVPRSGIRVHILLLHLVQLELAGLGARVEDQVLGGHRGGEGHPRLGHAGVIAS